MAPALCSEWPAQWVQGRNCCIVLLLFFNSFFLKIKATITLLRYHWYPLQFTHLQYTIQWLLAYSEFYFHHHNPFQELFITPKRRSTPPELSHPKIPIPRTNEIHRSAVCLHGLAQSRGCTYVDPNNTWPSSGQASWS